MAFYAEVVLPLPVAGSFTYAIPASYRNGLAVGMRVLVPFGARRLSGFVVDLTDRSPVAAVKPIFKVLDETPIIGADLLRLTRWVADYYLCSWGEALKAAVAPLALLKIEAVFSLNPAVPLSDDPALTRQAPLQAAIIAYLRSHSEATLRQIQRALKHDGLRSRLKALERKGLVQSTLKRRGAVPRVQTVSFVHLACEPSVARQMAEDLGRRAPKQKRCLERLLEENPYSLPRLMEGDGISAQSVAALERKGVVCIVKQETVRDSYQDMILPAPSSFQLTSAQRRALEEVDQLLSASTYGSLLLHGVTGSGKTLVYIEAIRRARRQGKSAIVLIPELSLTSQTLARFRVYLESPTTPQNSRIAVLHSGLSSGERYDAWRRIQSGVCDVVIGARSAIFAPVQRLGIVIVDEEHETSYKQYDEAPRYHARDVAVMRARQSNAVAILGSATPTLESYTNAQRHKYRLCELPTRIDGRPLPRVHIVDMRQERQQGNWSIFSQRLQTQIADCLQRREQVILFLNRRGFSTLIICQDCGFTAHCPACDVTLTYHRKDHSSRCHYCGFQQPAPSCCPQCQGIEIKFKGTGTQRVEEEITRRFPGARLVRMDLDTTGQKGAHRRIYETFLAGEADILLGTQMIAKGLDFPKVTLVGVISADTALHLPDFRASERTFQLLTQVAGRTGRSERGGEVIIQTYTPNNFSILCAQNHDYHAFCESESKDRQALKYPPFGHLVLVLLQSEREEQAARAAQQLAEALRRSCPANAGLEILGPAPSPLTKIRKFYRWQFIIKYQRSAALHSWLQNVLVPRVREYNSAQLRVHVDVDPVAVL